MLTPWSTTIYPPGLELDWNWTGTGLELDWNWTVQIDQNIPDKYYTFSPDALSP